MPSILGDFVDDKALSLTWSHLLLIPASNVQRDSIREAGHTKEGAG